MSESSTNSAGIPWPVILSVVTALGAIAHFIPPLTSSRPSVPEGTSSIITGYEDMDARLWQDPLQAIDADNTRRNANSVSDQPHQRDISGLLAQIDAQSMAPKVLAVMLPGLPPAVQ